MKCSYNDTNKSEKMECNKEARWELGFSSIIRNDSSGFLCGDNVSHTDFFCDIHFIGFEGCGNLIEFRKIGDKKWRKFDGYDNLFILQDLVKDSYKLYINNEIKFKKINKF